MPPTERTIARGPGCVPGMRRASLPLTAYFAATYGCAWGCWLLAALLARDGRAAGLAVALQTLGAFAPGLVAVVFAARERPGGARALLGRFRRWRVHPGWYLAALVGPPLAMLAGLGLHLALGGRAPQFPDAGRFPLVALNFLAVLLLGGPLGEEPGWRGYALPGLRRRLGTLPAGFALGAIWGCWHLPLFLLPGTPQAQIPFALYLVQALPLGVLFAWLYEGTGGSLLLATLLHAAINTWPGPLRILPDATGSVRPFALVTAIVWVLAVAVAVGGGLSRRPTATVPVVEARHGAPG